MRGVDLTGKQAIVTGGYAGLGLETTRVFAAAGAEVVVPARDVEKAVKATAGMLGVKVVPMDLMDTVSIDNFARTFVASGRPLHLLINNAGIMWVPLKRDARGFESHFATNHLGHFQLTARLWPALLRAQGARVVQVSSWGHRFSPVVFDDLHFDRRDYDGLAAYGQSKTANNLYALELDRRGRRDKVRAFSLHPGAIVDTDLKRHASAESLAATGVYDADGNPIRDAQRGLKTIAQGAATQVFCAVSSKLEGLGGVYCEDVDVAPLAQNADGTAALLDAMSQRGVMPYSVDLQTAQQLWAVTEQLLGLEGCEPRS